MCPLRCTYLLDEVLEKDGLLPQRVVHQALGEEDHPVGEVVLREPRHHTLLLHIGPTRDVDDQVAQVLPMPEYAMQNVTKKKKALKCQLNGRRNLPDDVDGSWTDFGVAAHDGNAGGERAVDAEDHALHGPRQHGEVGLRAGLIPPLGRRQRALKMTKPHGNLSGCWGCCWISAYLTTILMG